MAWPKGKPRSAETKAKISAKNVGNTYAKKPHKISEEQRAKISAANKGNKYRLGSHHTEEAKAKLSAANKGKPKPEGWGKAHGEQIRGTRFNMSEAEKIKQSESHKGLSNPEGGEAARIHENGKGRKVIIDGIEYRSMRKAGEALGIGYSRMVGYCRYRREEFERVTGHHIDWVENKND